MFKIFLVSQTVIKNMKGLVSKETAVPVSGN